MCMVTKIKVTKSIRVSEKAYRKLKITAAKEGRTIQATIDIILETK